MCSLDPSLRQFEKEHLNKKYKISPTKPIDSVMNIINGNNLNKHFFHSLVFFPAGHKDT